MENPSPSPESSPKLKPLESSASSGWTYNQIGGCPSVLHHAPHIHGNPRLSHDHLCSFKHFLTEEGVLILTSWPKCNTDNCSVLCNILSGVHWCFPALPIMVMWWSSTEMATLPEESPLCQTLQCYRQTPHVSIFPAMAVQPQCASHSDFHLHLCKRPSLKICPLTPELCWAFHFPILLKRYKSGLHTWGSMTNMATSTTTKVEMDLLEEPQFQHFSFLQEETRTNPQAFLLHQNHLLAFLTSTHVVTIRTGILGSGTGGILNRHTGTHQNIRELPKWNWHHGSGLYHTSEKGFTTGIKQVNSSAPWPARAAWCWAAIVIPHGCFTWLPASPLHFAGSEVKDRENQPELQQGTCKRTETADCNNIFPLRQKQHQHYQKGTQECFSL